MALDFPLLERTLLSSRIGSLGHRLDYGARPRLRGRLGPAPGPGSGARRCELLERYEPGSGPGSDAGPSPPARDGRFSARLPRGPSRTRRDRVRRQRPLPAVRRPSAASSRSRESRGCGSTRSPGRSRRPCEIPGPGRRPRGPDPRPGQGRRAAGARARCPALPHRRRGAAHRPPGPSPHRLPVPPLLPPPDPVRVPAQGHAPGRAGRIGRRPTHGPGGDGRPALIRRPSSSEPVAVEVGVESLVVSGRRPVASEPARSSPSRPPARQRRIPIDSAPPAIRIARPGTTQAARSKPLVSGLASTSGPYSTTSASLICSFVRPSAISCSDQVADLTGLRRLREREREPAGRAHHLVLDVR